MNRLAKWSLPTVLASILAGPATAQDVFLVAQPFTQTMPDGTEVPMWGYASATDASCPSTTIASGPSAPGPEISVAATDPNLTISLCNELTAEPVSVVIPGQAMPKNMAGGTIHPPVFFGAGKFNGRVKSFTAEAAAGNGTETYVWEGLKPGTYLYHSGTHQQVQMQMGLYGAVKKNASDSPLQAYGVDSAWDNELVLLYSEIDLALHTAVGDGDYDPFTDGHDPNNTKMTSIADYRVDYFLINGLPFPAVAPAVQGSTGTLLLRMLNAGLHNHIPIIQGLHADLIAEDGYPYPFKHNQYSVRLPAGTTRDVLLDVDCSGVGPLDPSTRHVIYDGRMRLSNAGGVPGGLLVNLQLCGTVADLDFDGADGLPDDQDNCIQRGNGPDNLDAGNNSQLDTNSDGYGNICDPDLDNDGIVNFNDLSILGAAFFSTPASASWNADADFDGDGIVNFNDLGIMGSKFFGSPGPSALAP